MSSSNNLSYAASVKNLKWFFEGTEGNSITPKQIYIATGRESFNPATNKSWLSNKTHGMKKHGLFVKEYAKGGFHEFNKLALTEAGIKALNRTSSNVQVPAQTESAYPIQVISLQEITALVDEFNRQNPSWEFELVPKRVSKEVMPTK